MTYAHLVLSLQFFDMGALPPCSEYLLQHIKRVNYQLSICKRSHIQHPQVPDPEGHGWVHVNNRLEPLWYDCQMLPQDLADVAANQYINESEDVSESEESNFDMDEINDHIHPNIIESLSDDDE